MKELINNYQTFLKECDKELSFIEQQRGIFRKAVIIFLKNTLIYLKNFNIEAYNLIIEGIDNSSYKMFEIRGFLIRKDDIV